MTVLNSQKSGRSRFCLEWTFDERLMTLASVTIKDVVIELEGATSMTVLNSQKSGRSRFCLE